MGGGMPQNNRGGAPPQYNSGGVQPQYNTGGGQPHYNTGADEEEDEIPTSKYIPSWANKTSVALVLSSQQNIDPDVIFPPESFCSSDEEHGHYSLDEINCTKKRFVENIFKEFRSAIQVKAAKSNKFLFVTNVLGKVILCRERSHSCRDVYASLPF
ncbi:hypothetical protein RHGRI_018721 [Rhododendron griersonianum]|uniref:Inner centromere protein ARK-binding domain-containing protein n=1 Tax=Rhododendron griersonianum TaxID=479676 RepID=A0AAV6K2G0_9ERIC|nr:hypothetical protein RHGRI_018721 [Rhododendron griersonianum]